MRLALFSRLLRINCSQNFIQRISSDCNMSSPTEITEGKATVRFPAEASVFYNPVQEFNRDLSVCVLRQFVANRLQACGNNNQSEDQPSAKKQKVFENIRILEALAASGLRAVRYAKEIPHIGNILANDFSEQAVACMRENVKRNGVENLVTPNFQDAVACMHSHKRYDLRFNVVDLDPYGSPSIFLDAAIQCVEDEGLLMVTCTDMAVLCGNVPETCHAKYGSMPIKARACHEIALRVLLQCIESHANRHSRFIEPLLCVSVDFYIRCFLRIHSGASKVKNSVTKLGYVFQCTGCESLTFQPMGIKREDGKSLKYLLPTGPAVGKNCPNCNRRHHMGGPIWLS